MISNFNEKLNLLNKYIKEYKVDGILLFSPVNRHWFLDFESSYGWLFITEDKVNYIVDSRYYNEVCDHFKNDDIEVIKLESNLISIFNEIKKKLKLNKVLIESEYMTLSIIDIVCQAWNFKHLIAFNSKTIREYKFKNELTYLQKSADIVTDTFNWLLTQLKPGLSEKEVSKMISIKLLELGAEGNSFDPIVAANINGANPHHKSSDYKLQDGDMVTLDFGCMYNGYASDMTRTVVLGNECNNKEVIDIYNIVLEANKLGIDKATNKISGYELDKLVRDYIDETKYKGMFCHGLGHGVGLEVHELPNANASNKNIFVNNNVITVEPGIYCKDVGGVRIEDTIIIENNEPIILTKNASKELIYIDYSKN